MTTTARKHRSIVLEGLSAAGQADLVRAEARDRLGRFTEIDLEFVCPDPDIAFEDVLGTTLSVGVEDEAGEMRYFSGRCVDLAFQGQYHGESLYYASLRSWPWYLSQTTDCRIFQGLSAVEIVKQVIADFGFTGDVVWNTLEDYAPRAFCVQYRETALDFVLRLMAEEGLYFHPSHERLRDTITVVDTASQLPELPVRSSVEFIYREQGYKRRDDHVFDWREHGIVRSATVVLDHYDYLVAQGADLSGRRHIGQPSIGPRFELYDYPTAFVREDLGPRDAGALQKRTGELSTVRAEALAATRVRATGSGNVRQMRTGHRFSLEGHERAALNREYLVVGAVHQMQIEGEYDRGELSDSVLALRTRFEAKERDEPYRVSFLVQPAEHEFRLPVEDHPRPAIAGLQTAVVVGPEGEEVFTDGHGRIKVQFHWDRRAPGDDASSCWIRTAVPWSGGDYGAVFVPRIGQEVVVQFEEGDPDRPVVVGMLYNETNRLPLSAAELTTTIGLESRSTKRGSASMHNRLMLCDAKGAELVEMVAEKDYTQRVHDTAEITVGDEPTADGGTYTLTVRSDHTETCETGDRTITVAEGAETRTVAKDSTVTIRENSLHTAKAGLAVSVGGGEAGAPGAGNAALDAAQAVSSESTSVSVKASQGVTVEADRITLTAGSGITLQVGGSTIEMSGGQIKILSADVAINE